MVNGLSSKHCQEKRENQDQPDGFVGVIVEPKYIKTATISGKHGILRIVDVQEAWLVKSLTIF